MYLKQPKVSILIPAYNIERYLDECLESIINQTYQNKEVIIIDDGSTDRTAELADDWSRRYQEINVIRTKNQGVAIARNIALDAASGDLFLFVDSDDLILEYHVEDLVDIYLKEDVDLVLSKYTRKIEELDLERKQKYEIYDAKTYIRNLMDNNIQTDTAITPWAKLYKKELFEGVRYPGHLIYEDQVVSFEILSKIDRLAVSDNKSYYYRETIGSIMKEEVRERFLDSLPISKLIEEVLRKSQRFSDDDIIRYSTNVIFNQYIRTLSNRDQTKNWIGDKLYQEYKKIS